MGRCHQPIIFLHDMNQKIGQTDGMDDAKSQQEKRDRDGDRVFGLGGWLTGFCIETGMGIAVGEHEQPQEHGPKGKQKQTACWAFTTTFAGSDFGKGRITFGSAKGKSSFQI